MTLRQGFLFLAMAMTLVSCSKIKNKIQDVVSSPRKSLVVTPSGGIYKSDQEWQEKIKYYGTKNLHDRAIRSAQDWKKYIMDIFQEARENPPSSVKPFPWVITERSFVLYSDFLNTGKPTAVLMETMPNLPTLKALIVGEWDKGQWNELLRMDENGSKTPYLFYPDAPGAAQEGTTEYEFNVKGFTIRVSGPWPGEKNYLDFGYIGWDTNLQRYCFDEPGPGESAYRLCSQKGWGKE